jgi:predicted secreted protein
MSGKKGFGAKLEFLASTGPDVWTEIANVTKIRPFNMKVDVIDVTSMQSANEVREKLAGLKDMGQCVMDLNWDDKSASHVAIKTLLGTLKTYRLTWPGTAPTVSTFSGFLQTLSGETPYDNKMTAQAGVEIAGVITDV